VIRRKTSVEIPAKFARGQRPQTLIPAPPKRGASSSRRESGGSRRSKGNIRKAFNRKPRHRPKRPRN